MTRKIKFQFLLLISYLLITTNCFALYQPGDTIQIAALEYITDTIQAEWNATNETSVPGKNVPMELDGRIVIGNPKTGSILSYPIMVGAKGGSFVLEIEYKGFTGGDSEGYIYLSIDNKEQEKIWLRTEGWNIATSKPFILTPGFHTIYTQYKGSSGTFNIDRFMLSALPGTLQEKKVRLINAMTYDPDTIQLENYDVLLSKFTLGKFTIEGKNPTYVTNVQDAEFLVFPFSVGAGGGSYTFQYKYKKLSPNIASIKLHLDNNELETIMLTANVTNEWDIVETKTPLAFTPGKHQLKIEMQGTESHLADYFILSPEENSLFTSNPKIWVTPADFKRITYNIEHYNWASDLLSQLKARISKRVNQHIEDPEYLCSRIPRTWGNCDNYTDATNDKPPHYSGNATITTIHRGTYGLTAKTVEGGYTVKEISIDDIPPYNSDPLFGMELHYKKGNTTTSGDDKLKVNYLGSLLINIHTDFLNLAFDCASAYYLTGNTDFAQLAADIVSAYTEGLSVMNMASNTYGGLLFTDSYIVEARYSHVLPLAYDLIKSFISAPGTTVFDPITKGRKPFDEEAVQKYFANQINCTLNSGLGDNNWAVMESPVAWYSLMNLTDESTRSTLFNKMYVTGAEKRQDPLPLLIDKNVNEQGAWAESFNYSVDQVKEVLMFIESIDRVWPELNLLENNMHLVDGCNFFQNFYYPNGENARFGDSHRGNKVGGEFDYSGFEEQYELIYRLADNNPNNAHMQETKKQMGKYLRYYYGSNSERNHTWKDGGFYYNSPLRLFWGYDYDEYSPEQFVPSTNKIAKRQGIVAQRNFFGANNNQNGLMCYTGGASYVHSDCSGLDMELYGLGEVLGVTGGEDRDRASSFHNNYLKEYPGHNSVTVNGISKGIGGWGDSGMPTTQTVSLEPLMDETPISENFSFTQQLINDETQKYDQQRTLSIIRTSPGTGYYFDLFRSKGDGLEDKFHDYLYHNIGNEMKLMDVSGNELPTTTTNNRFSNFLNNKGWSFIEDINTTDTISEMVKVRFAMTSKSKYMHAIIAAAPNTEYSKALSPATVEAPIGYEDVKTPLLIIRKNGEAWNQPFVVAYEPSENAEPSIKSIENLMNKSVVVGAIVKSEIEGVKIDDYIIAPDKPSEFNLDKCGIKFNGQFAIVRTIEISETHENVILYIGDGTQLSYGSNTLFTEGKKGLQYFENIEKVKPNLFYTLTLTANSLEGYINQSLEQTEFISGTNIELTAIANDGYVFTYWSGDVSSTDNPLSVRIDSNINITANFTTADYIPELKSIKATIVPNPSTGKFRISAESKEKCSYTLFNILGTKIQSGYFVGNTNIEVKDQGTYLIRISSDQGLVSFKLIVL